MAILISGRRQAGRRSRRGLAILAPAVHFLLVAGVVRAAALPEDLELRLKAAFVYNFAKFVEWPEDPSQARSPVTFCVPAGEPFADTLERSLEGKNLNGRVVVIRRIAKPQQAHACHVLALTALENKQVEEYLSAMSGWSVLTIGDGNRFTARGGMIQLIKDVNKLRFAVNLNAVNRVGLKISSRLLQLSEVVHEPEGAGKP